MRGQRNIGDIEAAFIYLRLCQDMMMAGYAMRGAEYGSIPRPLYSRNGTFDHQIEDGCKIIGHCDPGRCARSGWSLPRNRGI